MRKQIQTEQAPAAIGSYSQAIVAGNHIYLSGQIPIDPATQNLVEGDFAAKVRCVFNNIQAVANAAGASLENVVKLTVYLTDLSNITIVNEIMKEYFSEPYPARTSIGVSQLPKMVPIEIEVTLSLN